jgi:anti-sigma regulatory factor (Ser/Thr protein kinase)
MEVNFTDHIQVTDPSSVGEVRRTSLMTAQRLNFGETRAGEFALLATEASRNVLLHGGGGQIVLTGIREKESEENAIGRILAIDQGPGIANISLAMSDGYSTAGTMGGGMGAMKRMASVLDVFTGKGGTVLLVQIGHEAAGNHLEVSGLAVPYPGERYCGDAWTCHRTAERTITLLVDGLGHGMGAAEAAQEAAETFRRRAEGSPAQILSHVHDALKKTRGAVASVAEIRPREGVLNYAGIGNIGAVVLSRGGSRSLVSHNGTLGATIAKIQEFKSEWPSDGVLVMHSDGLMSRWDLSPYAGLLARHAAVIGGTLLRDFRRQRDDASVVVIKAA